MMPRPQLTPGRRPAVTAATSGGSVLLLLAAISTAGSCFSLHAGNGGGHSLHHKREPVAVSPVAGAAAGGSGGELSRYLRYWNDDLYPCIEKYCGQFVATNMYVRCLSKFCQRGVLTVPARDVDDDNSDQHGNDVGAADTYESAAAAVDLAPPAEDEDDALLLAEAGAAGGSSGSAVSVLARETHTLLLYCHDLLCPLDMSRGGGTEFWHCARDKCLPWFDAALKERLAESGVADYNDKVSSLPSSSHEHFALLRGAIRHLGAATAANAAATTTSSHRHQRLTLDSEAAAAAFDPAEADSRDLLGGSQRAAAGDVVKQKRGVISMAKCTVARIGKVGCDWQTLYRKKNAPLARKRRINDDVSQCIQSYCGGKNDLNQRMVCVIKHCHRIRSFN